MATMIRRSVIPAFLLLGVLALPAAGASSSSNSSSSSSSNNDRNESRSRNSSHSDQDDARDALRRGKVMPLTAILEIAFRRVPGTVLEAELETEDGVLTYKIDILSDAGRKTRIRLNARNGDIIEVRNR